MIYFQITCDIFLGHVTFKKFHFRYLRKEAFSEKLCDTCSQHKRPFVNTIKKNLERFQRNGSVVYQCRRNSCKGPLQRKYPFGWYNCY